MNATPDYYALLGVARNATDDEIKRAYRKLARQYHPDANAGDGEAEARFKEISVAYETLSSPEKRRQYDTFGSTGMNGGFTTDAFGINDLFDAFFGGDPFGGRRPGGPPSGHDVEMPVRVTLADVAAGATRTIEVRCPVACARCDGAGAEPGTYPTRCSACNGAGEVRQVRRSMFGQVITSAACDVCNGAGEIVATPCKECRGEGRVHGAFSLDIEVPAGIADGQRLRYAGRGAAGPRRGQPGDLYVRIDVEPHSDFERHGDDLVTARRIAYAQAVFGTHLPIETLEGPEELVVPAGTPSGRVFRLRGRGIPHLRERGRGDLLVRVDIDIPDSLPPEQEALLRQLAEMRGEELAPQSTGLLGKIKSAFQ
ncbi:MAG: molecular chaperone DnaJ [Acidimicrobiia bacterium]